MILVYIILSTLVQEYIIVQTIMTNNILSSMCRNCICIFLKVGVLHIYTWLCFYYYIMMNVIVELFSFEESTDQCSPLGHADDSLSLRQVDTQRFSSLHFSKFFIQIKDFVLFCVHFHSLKHQLVVGFPFLNHSLNIFEDFYSIRIYTLLKYVTQFNRGINLNRLNGNTVCLLPCEIKYKSTIQSREGGLLMVR